MSEERVGVLPGRESIELGRLAPLKIAPVPRFRGLFAYVGPAFIWASLAQGSGELIWWPFLTTKYGAAFLGLLIPASLLQFWVNQEIVRYTAATGETILTGFSRAGWWLVTLLALGLLFENIWFGAYASAGGTALADLTKFPASWDVRGRSLFWGYLTVILFLGAMLFGRVVYLFIEKFSMVIIAVTMGGVTFAMLQQEVLDTGGAFFKALLVPGFQRPHNWDPADLKIVLTSLAFAGSGGFGNFFFSYWIRDKGLGMARYIGRVTSPITGKPETIPATGYAFQDTAENRSNYRGFIRALCFENALGVGMNLFTTIVMCWLAWALLRPTGLIPEGWQIAVVQSSFFEVAWGPIGRSLFLIVAASFLCDNWVQLADGSSRFEADFVYSNWKWARRFSFRTWYYLFLALFSALTFITMPLAEPGAILAFRGTIAFLVMGLYCPMLIYLNFHFLPRSFPSWVKPHPLTRLCMWLVSFIYVAISLWFLYIVLRG